MQQDPNMLEIAKLILQFAIVPMLAFMWMHYKLTQGHATEIAVMRSEHALVKENHDREFKELRESIKMILMKLDEIQRDMQKK
jgi:hypothetical protein